MKTIILSDLHLGVSGTYATFESTPELLGLLEHLAAGPALRLFLNGDAVDFLLDGRREGPTTEAEAVDHARRITADNAAVFAAMGRLLDRGGELVLRLGNHDLELALAGVQEVFRAALVGDQPARARRISFVRGDWPSFVRVGEATVLVTHGEHRDGANRVRYGRLPGPGGPAGASLRSFEFPAGSLLVRRGLNPLKAAGLRFADLVKPDFQGGFFAAAAVNPAAVEQVLGEAGLDFGLAYIRETLRGRTFAEGQPDPLGLTDALRVLALSEGERAALGRALSGQTAVSDADLRQTARAAAKALRRLAQLHRQITGPTGARFFDLSPSEGEWKETRRLARKFDVRAVILGHTHAARWGWSDGLVFANTGTWIPLVRLPPPLEGEGDKEENLQLWMDFISDLRQDPQLRGVAAHRIDHLRTFLLAEPTANGARLQLCEWRDGRVRVVDREEGPCQVHIPAVPARAQRRGAPASAPVEGTLWSLLADSHGAPLLPRGVPLDRLQARAAPLPRELVKKRGPLDFQAPGAEENPLFQGWGLIVPKGERRRVDWTGALVAHRAADPEIRSFLAAWEVLRQRGDLRTTADQPLPVFEVQAGAAMDVSDAEAWSDLHIGGLRDSPDPREGAKVVPLYVLILADLNEISPALDRALTGAGLLVGRLAFVDTLGVPDEGAYRAYAEKVVRHERRPAPVGKAPVLLYAPEDHSDAVIVADVGVLSPTLDMLGQAPPEESPFAEVRRLDDALVPGPESLLDEPALREAAVLFTISHGRLADDQDAAWQRQHQGAMSFGRDSEPLDAATLAEHLKTRPFLPGGVWFFLACFGAGTPAESVYAPWLEKADPTDVGPVRDSLRGLAKERPFIAALPQVALASPDGPVAVIGHVDLAWTYAMQRHGVGALQEDQRFAPRRFVEVLRALGTSAASPETPGVWGHGRGGPQRVGLAFNRLASLRRDQGVSLAALASISADSKVSDLAYPDCWLSYHDLSGYILLGDPAAHLPLTEPASAVQPEVSDPGPSPAQADAPVQAAVSAPEALRRLLELVEGELVRGPSALGAVYAEGGREALRSAGIADPEVAQRALLAWWRGDWAALGASGMPRSELERLERLFREGGRASLRALIY